MRDHQLIFTTDMVNEIIDGTRTMTRRTTNLHLINEAPDQYHPIGRICQSFSGNGYGLGFKNKKTRLNVIVKVPYDVGDTILVKETGEETVYIYLEMTNIKVARLHDEQDIYGETKRSKKHNPWVWVISFKVISTTGKPITYD